MKTILSALAICTGLCGFAANFTVKWTFKGVLDGYDHDNKVVAYVDGKKVGESRVFKQTANAEYTFSVPSGKHTVKIEDYALYEGNWELHTKTNSYSVDAIYEEELQITGKVALSLEFDITEEVVFAKLEPASGKEAVSGSEAALTIEWTFKGVIEGYDHENRMQVYVDGALVETSKSQVQTKPGSFTLAVPAGKHEIRVENYTLYEGEWEPHTKANEYSVDAFYTAKVKFKKGKTKTVKLLFDIDAEKTTATVN